MTKETRLASLSTLGEFYLVILLCFGVQIILAVRAVVRHWKGGVPREVQVGNAGVLRLVTLELLCLWVALWIGSLRGWSLVTLGLHISWMGTFMGGLLFAAFMVQATLFALALKAFGVNAHWTSILPGTTLPFVLLVSIVNPVFEEAIGAGYVIHALQQFGMWPAVLASAFLRDVLTRVSGAPNLGADVFDSDHRLSCILEMAATVAARRRALPRRCLRIAGRATRHAFGSFQMIYYPPLVEG